VKAAVKKTKIAPKKAIVPKNSPAKKVAATTKTAKK
jgi:hypothetical protein